MISMTMIKYIYLMKVKVIWLIMMVSQSAHLDQYMARFHASNAFLLCMTFALQCNGHSLILMMKYIGLPCKINSLDHLFLTYYDFKYVCTRTMTLDLEYHVYILTQWLSMRELMSKNMP